ncbi:YihY/virulence factor BrkB family protein [Litoreibacter roseus]|uniref:YihY/virulence factor BrkB family protein n=1 Tax=Litoreibacter roseus TaxID=2601869 RepID=A0A6N6JCR9_9RHOB|nr:YihY/virulence factor BrkB family protein [Litoreibacter roseus]GFE63945.1 hypothetical protein KIN_10190 [Litoreibacter roseus]
MMADWRRVWKVAVAVGDTINEKNLSLIASGIAFFGLLSVFPAIAAMVSLWGLVSDPSELQAQLVEIRSLVPEQAFELIDGQISALILARDETLGWTSAVSLLFALWSARAGVSALMRAMNAIYQVPARGNMRHYADALLLTVLLIAVAFVALASVVIMPVILAIFPIGTWTELAIDGVRWAAAIFVIMAALGVLYRYGPNRQGVRTNWLTPGAVLTLFLWVLSSAAFSIYLSRFGNYNEVYGSIGAVIALLMWFYISAFLVLVGAATNAYLEGQYDPEKPEPAPGQPPQQSSDTVFEQL